MAKWLSEFDLIGQNIESFTKGVDRALDEFVEQGLITEEQAKSQRELVIQEYKNSLR